MSTGQRGSIGGVGFMVEQRGFTGPNQQSNSFDLELALPADRTMWVEVASPSELGRVF